MTYSISKDLRINAVEDKEKHGYVFPDIRPPIHPGGDTKGISNDQNMNTIFGQNDSSFFNRNNNSIALTAVSYFSGLQHYNKDDGNDLISLEATHPMIKSIDDQIDAINNDANLTALEKQEQTDFLNDQKSNLVRLADDVNEEPINSLGPRGTSLEEDNFNPDFLESSIAWRYNRTSFQDQNRASSQDNVSGGAKVPNIAYPLDAVNNGSFNYDAGTAFVTIQPAINPYGSDETNITISNANADITRIMNKYI